MGTTLTNMYFFPAPEKKGLVSKLQKHFKAEGYKATKGEEEHDLSLTICTSKDKPCFISLDAIDRADAESLVVDLVESLACDVLSADIYDSDFLTLIYRKYAEKQSQVLSVGYSLEEEEFIRQGDISALFPLVSNEDARANLARIWEAEYVSEDERLQEMLALFDCDNTLYPEYRKKGTLRFTRQNTKEQGYEIVREGEPRLKIGQYSLSIINNRGAVLSFNNIGGPSKGLILIMYGEFIDVLLQDPTRCDTVMLAGYANPTPLSSNDNLPHHFVFTDTLSPQKLSNGRIGLVARFPDAPVHNGFIVDYSRHYNSIPAWERFSYFFNIVVHITLSVNTKMEVQKLPLIFLVAPLENSEKGSASVELDFWFDEKEWEKKSLEDW